LPKALRCRRQQARGFQRNDPRICVLFLRTTRDTYTRVARNPKCGFWFLVNGFFPAFYITRQPPFIRVGAGDSGPRSERCALPCCAVLCCAAQTTHHCRLSVQSPAIERQRSAHLSQGAGRGKRRWFASTRRTGSVSVASTAAPGEPFPTFLWFGPAERVGAPRA
jgi:hypothetical protein